MGALPPGPPFCPPPLAKGLPAFWAPLVAGWRELAARPLLRFCGGETSHAPRHGGFAPLDPRFPTPVGLGFASVLGPTRGGLLMWANRPLILFWGHIPQTPWEGACAPSTPVLPTPVG